MANWLAVIDQNEDRRADFMSGLPVEVSPIGGLKVGSVGGRGWNVVWAAAEVAPIDVNVDADGGAVVFGEARNSSGKLQSAKDVRVAWRHGAVAQWDGYYSAVVIDETDLQLTVGADVLGIFPVYHWTDNEGVALVGSSPELFRRHPLFKAELSVFGLVGIMLTNGIVDGQSLLKDVFRLEPGFRFRVKNERAYTDIGYAVPTDLVSDDLPFRGHVKRLESAVEAAVNRHAPAGRSYGMMLSGGLDSRLLAGYMAKQGATVNCLTFGLRRDVEMQCAKSVSRALGFSHLAHEIPPTTYASAAKRLARWEWLAAGFSGVPEWAMHEPIAKVGDRVVVGHIFDGIVGGIHVGWAYDAEKGELQFEKLLPTILAWGIGPENLKTLFEREHRHTVEEVMARVQSIYDGAAEREHHKAWLFDLRHRQRFHVGSALWPVSFAAWPVAPFLDREVLSVSAALPCSAISGRRVQYEMLLRNFPNLARVPLDRNSRDLLPPVPQLSDYVKRSIRYRVDALRAVGRKLSNRTEQEIVYYSRLYNINSAGWRAVRELSEPSRSELYGLLDSGTVDLMWPRSGHVVQADDGVKDTSSTRNLMGLSLCRSYLRNEH